MTGSAPRVGFPQLCLQDSALGVRDTDNITAFPAGITAGATWDKDLIYQRGVAIGQEFRGKGANVYLGPVVGPLGRKPRDGRSWEGFGADPVLAAKAASATIQGCVLPWSKDGLRPGSLLEKFWSRLTSVTR